jgi:hypothetical protein
MIARRKDSAAALAKPSDTLTVPSGKTVTRIDCEEPQLIAVLKVQLTQDWVVVCGICLPIARSYVNKRISIIF